MSFQKVFGDNNVEEKEERGEEGRKEGREKINLKTNSTFFQTKKSNYLGGRGEVYHLRTNVSPNL